MSADPPVRAFAGVCIVLTIAGAGYGLLNVAVFELLDRVADAGRANGEPEHASARAPARGAEPR